MNIINKVYNVNTYKIVCCTVAGGWASASDVEGGLSSESWSL